MNIPPNLAGTIRKQKNNSELCSQNGPQKIYIVEGSELTHLLRNRLRDLITIKS